MSVVLTSNFFRNARGLTLANGGGITWSFNANTNTITGTTGAGGGLSGANPTAQVGLAAVNGTAITYMTSDSAPALDVSIAPTWTSEHIFAATANPPVKFVSANNNRSIVIDCAASSTFGVLVDIKQNGSTFGFFGSASYGTSGLVNELTLTTSGATSLYLGTNGTNRVTVDGTTGSVKCTGALGWNGASPPAQVAGWGTPTGNAVVTNFPGGGPATLAQCSTAIAEILTIMKAHGMIGA